MFSAVASRVAVQVEGAPVEDLAVLVQLFATSKYRDAFNAEAVYEIRQIGDLVCTAL